MEQNRLHVAIQHDEFRSMAHMQTELRVQLTTIIRAQPQRVWELLTDAEDRLHWWPYLDIDVREGGEVREVWQHEHGTTVTIGRVLAIESGRLLRFAWQDPAWSTPTTVEIAVSAGESGSEVMVTETGFEALEGAESLLQEHKAGWIMHLEDLRSYAVKA
jgi:uncharacterized protein YndB with AHSA1/START domain